MQREPRPSVLHRVVAFDQDCLVARHLREIEPAVIGVVDALVDLAGPIGVDDIANGEIARPKAFGIDEAQRRHLDGLMSDAAPDIVLGEAFPEALLRLLGRQQVAHALRARLLRVVAMDAAHRCPQATLDGAIRRAHRVIEHHDLRCAGLALDQGLDLGVILRANLVFVIEVAHFGVVVGQDEGLPVERQVACDRAGIVDTHREVAIVALASRQAGAVRRIVGHGLDAEIGQILDGRLDPMGQRRPRSGRFDGSDIDHGFTRDLVRLPPIGRVALDA